MSRAYAILLQVEKQKELQISAMEFANQNVNATEVKKIALNKIFGDKKRQVQDKRNVTCEYCKRRGHIKDTCFKLHRVPSWYKEMQNIGALVRSELQKLLGKTPDTPVEFTNLAIEFAVINMNRHSDSDSDSGSVTVSVSQDSSSPPPPPSTADGHPYVDFAMEGVAASIKLLLKLVEDQKGACDKEGKHRGKASLRLRVRAATMVSIADHVRSRIRLALGLQGNDDDPVDQAAMRRELSASLAAQQSLEAMCSSLGKEKEIMAAELSRKVQELHGMEELLGDLRQQNEALLRKVNPPPPPPPPQPQLEEEVSWLKERNKALWGQALKSLEGCRAMKRKVKAVQEENAELQAAMDRMLLAAQPTFKFRHKDSPELQAAMDRMLLAAQPTFKFRHKDSP
ncbi:uncharacterized protein LOC127253423 isoform X1 [Andrographis paniculata]|uniref:uncharacterized protein LOC127253423 isoform X1 n=1 Tax=Andrographis paniculata TaxID=175694 RepID=UPI0021E95F77|nr:uncharacterized protein LOC127253423 isoform X1 [Andrographis paniculata]